MTVRKMTLEHSGMCHLIWPIRAVFSLFDSCQIIHHTRGGLGSPVSILTAWRRGVRKSDSDCCWSVCSNASCNKSEGTGKSPSGKSIRTSVKEPLAMTGFGLENSFGPWGKQWVLSSLMNITHWNRTISCAFITLCLYSFTTRWQ